MIKTVVLAAFKSTAALFLCILSLASIASCVEISLSDVDDLFQFSRNQETNHDQTFKDRKLEASDLKPVIDVQAVLSDGIGWKGSMGFETAYQVVITVSGTDPESERFIPFSSLPVAVKLDGGHLRCIVEDGNGNGQFTKCDLSPEPFVFKTNMLGRISFSLPIPGLYRRQKSIFALPALLIRTDFMPKFSWIAAHVDDDAHYKLSNLQASTLQSLNPELGRKSAKKIASAISHIFKASQKQLPFLRFNSLKTLVKRGHTYLHPSLTGHGSMQYDSKYNRLPTYHVVNVTEFSPDGILGRTFVENQSPLKLMKRSVENHHDSAEWFKECESLLKRDLTDPEIEPNLISGDERHFWSLWSSKLGHYLAVFKDSMGHIYSYIIKTVSDVWKFVNLLLVRVHVELEDVLDGLKSFFDMKDVLNTQKFLSSYYLLLIPLGFRSHNITKDKYRELFMTSTKYLKNLTDYAFGLNMSISEYEKWSRTLVEGPSVDGIVFKPFGLPKHEHIIPKEIPKNILHSSDGLTHSMLDRIVNNIQHISMIDPSQHFNDSAWSRLFVLVKEAVKIITVKVPGSMFETLAPVFNEFGSFRDFKIKHLLMFFQRLMMAHSQISFLIFTSISHLLPIYWNTVTQLITFPIKIPFVYEWFTKRVSNGQTDLTLVDLLTLFGGTIATWTYKLYNDNYPPYTSTDIEVLQSNSEPELILYTWGHDPRTSDIGDNITHVHRLGIYDWIPKMHSLAIGTFTSLTVDIPTYFWVQDTTESHPAIVKANAFNVLVNVMQRAGYYPFTQLDTNDPEKIAHSKKYPDKRFLQWWLIQVFADFFKIIAPRLPDTFNRYPYAQIFNLVTNAVPNIAFGLKVQIDSIRQVNKLKDTARKAAVHLSWINQLTSIIGAFIPFCKAPKLSSILENGIVKNQNQKMYCPFQFSNGTLRRYQYLRDGITFFSSLLRNHILMSNHIVGLLSSSYQGKALEGGKRKEVIEKERLMAKRLQ